MRKSNLVMELLNDSSAKYFETGGFSIARLLE